MIVQNAHAGDVDEVLLRNWMTRKHRKRSVKTSQGMIHNEQFHIQAKIWHVIGGPSGTSPFTKANIFFHVE